MKQCSRDGAITEFMDMPCKCDCGRWFDLHDGYSKRFSKRVVCAACHEIDELEEQIETIEYDMESGDMKKREGKKEIKRLKAKIETIYDDDDNY